MRSRCTLMLSLLTLVLMCLFLTGCLTGCGPDARTARAVMQMNPQQRREAFAAMPPNKQLDVFLYAALKFEPGKIFLDDVAVNWRSVLPFVKDRLASSATSDAERIQLLWLLAAITDRYCSLGERQDVLTAASQSVAKMDDRHKAYAREPLTMILHSNRSKGLSPCH
jgi:hypothetical protein